MSFPPPLRRSMFALAAGANNRPLAPRQQLLLFASQKYGHSGHSSPTRNRVHSSAKCVNSLSPLENFIAAPAPKRKPH